MTKIPNTFRRAGGLLVGCAIAFAFAPSLAARAADFDARLDQYALDLAAASLRDGVTYFRSIDADLRAAGMGTPGMDMATLAGELTTDALAAELDEQAALQSVLLASGQVGGPFVDASADMI